MQAGARPPFPLVMHLHAVLMGAFLLLLLAQTWLVATGRKAFHMRLGLVSMLLVPAIVVVGFLLARGNYLGLWGAAQTAPPEAQAAMQSVLNHIENILLLQLRIGILFPLLFWIALSARRGEPGLHKRMMILATVVAIPAGIDRIPWLPTTMPASPVGPDFWTLVAISPMLIWDLARNRYLHRAYLIWLALFLPCARGRAQPVGHAMVARGRAADHGRGLSVPARRWHCLPVQAEQRKAERKARKFHKFQLPWEEKRGLPERVARPVTRIASGPRRRPGPTERQRS